jgi:hypothetical protein
MCWDEERGGDVVLAQQLEDSVDACAASEDASRDIGHVNIWASAASVDPAR